MSILSQTYTLFLKDLRLELRNKYALGSIALYVAATIVLIYIALSQQGAEKNMEVKYWNILFWIIMLFASVNAVAKSFMQEQSGRYYYYYSLAKPEAIILAKMIYNMLLMTVLTLLSYLLFSVMLGSPVKNHLLFGLVMLLGGAGFSLLFTLISSIAGKAGQNATLTAVLGFPLILPILIFLMKLSREAFFPEPSENLWNNMGILALFNVILFTLSLILFPYLWRD
jgi:heme exporter protein B